MIYPIALMKPAAIESINIYFSNVTIMIMKYWLIIIEEGMILITSNRLKNLLLLRVLMKLLL